MVYEKMKSNPENFGQRLALYGLTEMQVLLRIKKLPEFYSNSDKQKEFEDLVFKGYREKAKQIGLERF